MYTKNHLDYRDFKTALQSKNYAENTISNYSHYLGLFLEFTDKPRTRITSVDVKRYMTEISICDNSVKNQSISAIKLYFKYVLNKKIEYVFTERPRKQKKLPRVIDSSELDHRLSQIKNLKHKTILELGYRCGLRVSEVVNLEIKDIDSKKILIRNSKGNKDRYVPISESMLRVLRAYYRAYKPVVCLFEGTHGKYSVASCQKIFKKYIDANKSFHTLRHSCFTTMMERNTNLHVIQTIAGHVSSRTTEVYLHVANHHLQEAAL